MDNNDTKPDLYLCASQEEDRVLAAKPHVEHDLSKTQKLLILRQRIIELEAEYDAAVARTEIDTRTLAARRLSEAQRILQMAQDAHIDDEVRPARYYSPS